VDGVELALVQPDGHRTPLPAPQSQPATRPDRDAVVLALADLTTPTVEIAPFVRHEDIVLRARPVEVAVHG
jgi:hypothetical protein